MNTFKLGTIALLALLTPACFAEAGEEAEGEEMELTAAPIIGGAVENARPGVVIIRYDEADGAGKVSSYNCTGTLVSPTVVLTAAHCILPAAPGGKTSNWRVSSGSDARSATDWITASKAVPHPDYKPGAFGSGHDAGVLVLSKASAAPSYPVNRGNLGASAVGKNILAVGAGISDGAARTGVGTKRAATLPITAVRGEELSAGQKGRTTCNGDSGGPWLANVNGKETVIGITSYGPSDCGGASSATRVDRIMDLLGPYLDGDAGNPPAPGTKPPPPETKNPAPAGNVGTIAVGQTVNGTVTTETDTFTVEGSKLSLDFQGTSTTQISVQSSTGGRSVSSGRAQINISGGANAKFTISIRSTTGAAQSYTLTRN